MKGEHSVEFRPVVRRIDHGGHATRTTPRNSRFQKVPNPVGVICFEKGLCSSWQLSPHLPRDVHDERELGPLLVFREEVPLHRGREAALGGRALGRRAARSGRPRRCAGRGPTGTRTRAACCSRALAPPPCPAGRSARARTPRTARHALECGLPFFGADHVLFGTGMPFDPEKGPGFIRKRSAVWTRWRSPRRTGGDL